MSVKAQDLFLFGFDNYTQEQIISVVSDCDNLYHNEGESELSDEDYDTLYRYAKSSYPTDPYFLGVGSSIRGGKVDLPYQMGSLDQIYEGEIVDWIKRNNLSNDLHVITDKLDGASAMIVYNNQGTFQIAYSRGDGIQGADISRHQRQMLSVPMDINYKKPLTIRGENIVSKENFEKAKTVKTRSGGKPYKNARNMVSGLMNASENPAAIYRYIDFVAYEIVDSELSKLEQLALLRQLGFMVPIYCTRHGKDLSDNILTKYLEARRQDTEYEIDGIVIDVDSKDKRSQMNPTRSTLNPAYSIKYKIADASNMAIATVVDVEINISKHGYLKPRIQIQPVDLVGVTVTWATGFNMKFILDNQIGPGSKIQITRSGDVIPYCCKVIHPMPDYENNQ